MIPVRSQWGRSNLPISQSGSSSVEAPLGSDPGHVSHMLRRELAQACGDRHRRLGDLGDVNKGGAPWLDKWV